MGGDQGWDVVVVGGGTAGIVGAKTAAALGAEVALVERARTGGDCLWTGCVPSKALIAAARHAADVRRAPAFGVRTGDVSIDFGAVMDHVHRAIARIEPDDSPRPLTEAGVHVLSGTARFTGADGIEVADQRIRFGQVLLATGSEPVMPPVPGLADAEPLTSETVWQLRELPARLVVLGGGATGCELGQAFARLGSQVTVVEAGSRLLGKEDPDASAVVTTALEADGVHVRTNSSVVGVHSDAAGPGTVAVEGPGGTTTVDYDRLLVATGRRPRTDDLGLEDAGVDLDDSGHVRVDEHLRTTNPRVWAAGDVTSYPELTHVAGVHASMAATNAVLGLRRSVRPETIPRVNFTDPEVASVGAESWSETGPGPTTVTRRHADSDRAVTEARVDGFARLVLDGHRITGATLVGPRAGESLAELCVAVTQGLSTSDLAGTTHAYPTYADATWDAAIADVQSRLTQPRVRAVTGLVSRARRAWLRRTLRR